MESFWQDKIVVVKQCYTHSNVLSRAVRNHMKIFKKSYEIKSYSIDIEKQYLKYKICRFENFH